MVAMISFKNVIIDSNSLTGSSNKYGGGFYTNNANSIIFEKSVISRNDASDGNGGGFYLGGTISPVFTNCTVVDNIANLVVDFIEKETQPFMKNTIVFFNDGSSWCGSAQVDLQQNIVILRVVINGVLIF